LLVERIVNSLSPEQQTLLGKIAIAKLSLDESVLQNVMQVAAQQDLNELVRRGLLFFDKAGIVRIPGSLAYHMQQRESVGGVGEPKI